MTQGVDDNVNLVKTLNDPKGEIYRLAWSSDGKALAIPTQKGELFIYHVDSETHHKVLEIENTTFYALAWSPDNTQIAVTAHDNHIRILDAATGKIKQEVHTNHPTLFDIKWPTSNQLITATHENQIQVWELSAGTLSRSYIGHHDMVYSIALAPEGDLMASAAEDQTVRVWNWRTGELLATLKGHTAAVYHVQWSPDGGRLASAAADSTIRIWEYPSERELMTLQRHSKYVTAVSFSHDGQWLASKSGDGKVMLWNCHNWEFKGEIAEARSPSGPYLTSLAFNPKRALLATLGERDQSVRIWRTAGGKLPSQEQPTPSIHYKNAKVIVTGDTGVGKSGLSIVLSGKTYIQTDSTHNRRVYLFKRERAKPSPLIEEQHEIYLWDLAGQPGYRLIHQLHLHDAVVALIVFDSRNEVDPFRGVMHWVRALRDARAKAAGKYQMHIFLVAARTDRGGVAISRHRIDKLIEDYQLDGYFETSAREDWGIDELREKIEAAIDWQKQPAVNSTRLFRIVQKFIEDEAAEGHYLASQHDLYFGMLRSLKSNKKNNKQELVQRQFNLCLTLLESRGLLHRFSLGDMLLLKPEILDAYATALINAARAEPDGLGYLLENDVINGNFYVPPDERLEEAGQEKLLVLATLDMLLEREIALRVQSGETSFIVFPSQLTRELPEHPNPAIFKTTFSFEGSIANIYATLVVRLAQSGFFELDDIWKNAVVFRAKVGGLCGLYLDLIEDGRADLHIFYQDDISNYAQYHFEEYVHSHIKRRASSFNFNKEKQHACPGCGYVIPTEVIDMRKSRHLDFVECPVCDAQIEFDKIGTSILKTANVISKMDTIADKQRLRSRAASVIQGKTMLDKYDVFMCHNVANKSKVREIAQELQKRGIRPWLDEWALRPGLPWQQALEQQIQRVRAAAVFVGQDGIGPWQDMEMRALLREFLRREAPVIPVLLPDCEEAPELPVFLSGLTYVDFRKAIPDPFQRLIWGITGEE